MEAGRALPADLQHIADGVARVDANQRDANERHYTSHRFLPRPLMVVVPVPCTCKSSAEGLAAYYASEQDSPEAGPKFPW